MNKAIRANIIDLSTHFFLAVIFSSFIYMRSANPEYVVIFIGGAIFIDLDHLFDYFLCRGLRFDLKEFLSNIHLKTGKVYLFLHSWELVLIISLCALLFSSPYSFYLSFGMAVHLLVDNLKRKNKFFYLFLYRAWKKFRVSDLLPEAL